jgi:ABC-type transporter Mla MlaB component
MAALACGSREFEVDCASWERIDLALLSVLIQCAKVCGDQQADFELVNVPHEVSSGIRALRLVHRLRLSAGGCFAGSSNRTIVASNLSKR